ncbi:MAG: S-layer homology domain-containing protein, partial [Firmicutes bacterium]|nr:S-layer homology domain-containing protein [Bacillota bacterium]
MKKVLSFVLVLAMILGSVSMVFAKEFSDVKAGDDYEEAIATLSDLGVIDGYTDGSFKPNAIVTRGQMAKLLISALGLKTSAAGTTTNYPDVPSTSVYSGYIKYATELGIVKGYTDGTFKPDKQVSADEAITMTVRALGYNDESLKPATGLAAYVTKAMGLGMLDNVLAGSQGCDRGMVAQLIYNALQQQIGTVDGSNQWTATNKGTLIAPNYDMMIKRLTKANVEVGTAAAPYIVGNADVESALVDISKYLGAAVHAWKNDKNQIAAIDEVYSEFVTGVFKDVDGLGAITTDDTFAGYKLANADIVTAIAQIVNGEKLAADKAPNAYALNEKLTAAVVVNGNYITDIFSIQKWNPDGKIMMSAANVKALNSTYTIGTR